MAALLDRNAPSPGQRARFPVRKWLRRGLGGAAGLVAIVLAAALVLVHSLDRPWIKRRLQALVLANAGVAIDYGAVRVSLLSGVVLEDLVVRSPAALQALAPDLLRVGRVAVRWSTSSLMGRGPVVQAVEIDHVAVTVVVDEDARTSFDAIPSASPPATKPKTPLSRVAAEQLGALLPVGRIHVGDVALSLVKTDHGTVVEHDALRGLGLDLQEEPIAGGARVHLSLGTSAAPLEIELERHPASAPATAARARLWLGAEATPSDASLALDVQIVKQDLWPGLVVGRLAHVDAKVRFDAADGRTEITIAKLDLGDGAATAEASLELPDGALPIVHRAAGDVDVAHLLRIVPAGLVPVRARGHLHYGVDELALEHPAAAAALLVEGELADVEVTAPGGALSVGSARIALRAQPRADAGVGAEGTISLDGIRATSGAGALRAEGVTVKVDGERSGDGAWTGKAELRFASIEASGAAGAGSVAARDGRIEARVRDLHVDAAAPLASRGDVALEVEAASVDARRAGRASALGLRLRAHAPLSGAVPLALDAEIGASRLHLERPDGHVMTDAPARIELGLSDVFPDRDHPARTRAVAHAAVQLGALRASLHATKQPDALDYELTGDAAQLGEVRSLLPPNVALPIPWEQVGLTLRSSGHADGIGSPAPVVRHHTELRLSKPAWGVLAARSIAIDMGSSGTLERHEARAEVRAEALTVLGQAMGDEHLTMSVKLDRAAPSLRVELDNEGAPEAKLTASVAFDRARRAVDYDVDVRVARLSPLSPFFAWIKPLASFDISKLELRVASNASVVGLVSDAGPGGALRLSPDPLRHAKAEGTAEVRVAHFRWSEGDRAITVPALAWRAKLLADGERRAIDSDLQLDGLSLALGRHHVDVTDLHDLTSAALTGDPARGQVELTQHLSIRAVKQNVAPPYPIGDVAETLAVARDAEGLVRVRDLALENRAAGTKIALRGGLDLAEGRRRLSLRGEVRQDLARASTRPDLFAGRGDVAVDLAVDSPDLTVFHTRSTVRVEGADVKLPRAHVAFDGVDGEVPIAADLAIDHAGVELLRDVHVNPYAMLRFADQHPLLQSRSYLSIASVTTPMVSIAPFAANLQVDQNIVSLAQLEMGVRGGRVTGNCILDWNGARSTLHADVRASHLLSSHGEPFDGNAALQISVGDRSIEGRADILRIGRRHLLDLLDVQDPARTDPAINRIRGALGLGYPDRVRISFDHGFASAGVSFGGLARLVRVDDVRGIPVGPLLDKVVASLTNPEEEP